MGKVQIVIQFGHWGFGCTRIKRGWILRAGRMRIDWLRWL